jgi:hypothetical protein
MDGEGEGSIKSRERETTTTCLSANMHRDLVQITTLIGNSEDGTKFMLTCRNKYFNIFSCYVSAFVSVVYLHFLCLCIGSPGPTSLW